MPMRRSPAIRMLPPKYRPLRIPTSAVAVVAHTPEPRRWDAGGGSGDGKGNGALSFGKDVTPACKLGENAKEGRRGGSGAGAAKRSPITAQVEKVGPQAPSPGNRRRLLFCCSRAALALCSSAPQRHTGTTTTHL